MTTATGTLTNRISSTVSSPTVNYSAAYTATRASETHSEVSVKLNFSAWLNSSQSRLGTGIKLTVFARVNGGNWHSAVIKDNISSWSGTAAHTASITFFTNVPANTAAIEFYVSRTGSNYSGTAGILGSSGSPKRYTIAIPNYSSGSSSGGGTPSTPDTPSDSTGLVYVNVNGVWEKAAPYVRSGSVWKKAAPYVNVNGAWKLTEIGN